MDATRVSRLDGVVLTAATGTDLIQVGQPSDAFPRFKVTSDGAVLRGGGGSAPIQRPTIYPISITAGSAVAVPAVEAERSTFLRTPCNLTGFTQARLRMYLQALSGGLSTQEARIQWSTDLATWKYLDGNVGGPAAILGNSTTGVGARNGAWVNLSGVPDGDIVLRLTHLNGDGTGSVTFGNVFLEAI